MSDVLEPQLVDPTQKQDVVTPKPADVLGSGLNDPLTGGDGLVLPQLLRPSLQAAGAPKPDPDKVVGGVDKKLSRGLFDWKVTDAEATSSLDDLLSLDDTTLPGALAKLHQKGKLMRLLEEIPAGVYQSRGADLMRVYKAAPPAVLQKRMEDLLSYGLFDWAIGKGDVDGVLDILSVLPEAARKSFVQKDNGRWYDTLMAAKSGVDAAEAERKQKEEEQKLAATQQEITKQSSNKDGDAAQDANKPGFFKRVGAGVKLGANILGGSADLDDLQTVMGGDVAGVKFDEKQGNKLDFDLSLKKGLLAIDLPSLGIASVSMDGVTAGASSLRGLKVAVKWRTTKDPKNYLDLAADCLQLGDVSLKMGEDTYTISGLELSSVHIFGEDSPITQAEPMSQGDTLKLIGNQILSMFQMNLPALKGLVGADYKKPETIAERFAAQFSSDMNLSFSLGSLTIADVSKNGESMAKSVSVTDLSLKVGDAKVSDGLRAELAALQGKQAPTPEECARIDVLTGEIAKLDAVEPRLMALEGKATAATLSPEEQDELIELRNLARIGQVQLSIGKVSTGKVAASGAGADEIVASNVSVTATGGAIEEARRGKTRGELLDDAVLGKHKGAYAAKENKIPELKTTGSIGQLDVKNGSYLAGTNEEMGASLSASGVTFGMQGDALSLGAADLTATDVKAVEYGTKVGKVTAKNIGVNTDMGTYASHVTADEFGASGVDASSLYATRVDEVAGKKLDLDYAANGDTRISAEGVSGSGVHYDEKTGKEGSGAAETHVGSFGAGKVGFSMTGQGEDNVISMDASDVTAGDVQYVPSDVAVGGVSAKSLNFRMDDEKHGDGKDATKMHLGGTGIVADDISYGKVGSDGQIRVGQATVGNADLDIASDYSMKMKTGPVGVDDVKVGQVEKGKGTSVKRADLSNLDVGYGEVEKNGKKQTSVTAKSNTITASGIEHLDSRTKVKSGKVSGFDYGMVGDTQTIKAKGITARGIDQGGGQNKVASASANGVNAKIVDGGATTFGVKSGSLGGVDASGAKVKSAGFQGLSGSTNSTTGKTSVNLASADATGISHGGTGVAVDKAGVKGVTFRQNDKKQTMDVGVSSLSGFGISHQGSGTTVTGARANDLSYSSNGKTGVQTFGATDVTAGGIHSDAAGVDVKSAYVGGISGDVGPGGINANVDVIDAGPTWVQYGNKLQQPKGTQTKEGLAYVGNTNIQDVSVRDLQFGDGGDFTGSVGVGSASVTDVRQKQGDQSASLSSGTVKGISVTGHGGGQVTAQADAIDLQDARYKDASSQANVGSVSVKDTRAALSGLGSEEGISLDGVSAGSVNVQNLKGKADLWKLLDAPSTKPATTEGDAETTPDNGKFRADALSTASGTFRATVPITINLGWLGEYRADAKLSVKAQDGYIQLKDIKLDLSWLEIVGAIGNELIGVLTGGVKLRDYHLDINSSGKLNLWLDVALPFTWGLAGVPIKIELYDGKDIGLQNAAGSKGDGVRLQALAEGLANAPSKPEVDEKELDAALATSDAIDKDLEDIDPWVKLGDAKVDLSGLKLGNGYIGNDRFGANLDDGGNPNINRVDGTFTGGKGGGIMSDGFGAKDIKAGDLRVQEAKTGKVVVASTALTSEQQNGRELINKSQMVGGKVSSVDLKGVGYGKDLSQDKRFKKTGKR